MVETIVAAAVRFPVPEEFKKQFWRGQRSYPDHFIVSAPPPARHHTLMHVTWDSLGAVKFEDQGFITSTGRFVGRKEARQIAEASDQPRTVEAFHTDGDLFSEDLW